MTVNQDILDATIRHHLNMIDAGDDVAVRALKLLRTFDEKTFAEIAKFDPQAVSAGNRPRRLKALTKRLNDINRQARKEVLNLVRSEMNSIAIGSLQFHEQLHVPLALSAGRRISTQSRSGVRRSVRTGEFTGGRVRSGRINDHINEFFRVRGRQINETVRFGFLSDQSSSAILRGIRGTSDQSFRDGIIRRHRLELSGIVRSSSTFAANIVSDGVAAGNPDEYFEVWNSILDGRTCAICAARHKKIFSVDTGPFPPAHPNCRCIRVPLLKDGGEFEDESFDAWLRQQPRSTAEQVLGKTKAKLFAKGGLRVERFVDRPLRDLSRTREFTIEELLKSDSAVVQDAVRKAGLN